MRNLIRWGWLLVAAFSMPCGFAQPNENAGVLVTVDGRVRVSQGAKYVAGRAGMVVMPQDRVLVLDGARAVVKYADGCITKLKPNTLFVYALPSPCRGGLAETRTIEPVKVAMPETAGAAATGGVIGGVSVPVAAGIGAVVLGGAIAGIVVGTSGGGGLSDEELFLLQRQRPLSPQ